MKKISLFLLSLLALFCVSAKQVIKAEQNYTITNFIALDYNNNKIIPNGDYLAIDSDYDKNVFTFKNLDTKNIYSVNGNTLPISLLNKQENIYPTYYQYIKVINGYWAYVQQDFAKDFNNNIIPNSIGKFEMYNNNVPDVVFKYSYYLTCYSYNAEDYILQDNNLKYCYVLSSNIPKKILTDNGFYKEYFGVYNANWAKGDIKENDKVINSIHTFKFINNRHVNNGVLHSYQVYLDFNISLDKILDIEYEFQYWELRGIFGNTKKNLTKVVDKVFADEVIKVQSNFWVWSITEFSKLEKGKWIVYNEDEEVNYTYSYRITNEFIGRWKDIVYAHESYHTLKLTYLYESVFYQSVHFIENDKTNINDTDKNPDYNNKGFFDWLKDLVLKPLKWLFNNILKIFIIFITISIGCFIIKIVINKIKKR